MANERILVVDDDKLLRTFYSRLLAAHGYVPVCAGNGREGMDLLANSTNGFRLAIVDLLLPICTGWELIEYIHNSERHRQMPILAITGLSFSFDEFEKVRQLCDCVLLKGDFEIGRLIETVDRLVQEGHGAKLPTDG